MTQNNDTPRKPWYHRRRFRVLGLLILLGYFCLVPSYPRVTPETAGTDAPVGSDGLPDYFAVYEKTWFGKLSPPEDNGQRLLIATCGPRVLEQNYMVETYSWEEITGKDSKVEEWLETFWKPLCENMNIDPYERPEYLDSLGFYGHMNKLRDEKKKTGEDVPAFANDIDKQREFWNKLADQPWKAEDHPEIAAWLEARSPVLDLFGVAVRKPNFVCWRKKPNEDSMWSILLPDVQANRDFARDLRIRITERLGRGDTDGAWYDVMSLYYLGRKHYLCDPVFVIHLVGAAVEGMGHEAARQVLKHGNLSTEQLERFARELAGLPKQKVLDLSFESLTIYDILRALYKGDRSMLGGSQGPETQYFNIYALSYLPFDWNIAGKRVTEFTRESARRAGGTSWRVNPRKMMEYSDRRDGFIVEKRNIGIPEFALSVPLIRTRSRLIADQAIVAVGANYRACQVSLDRVNAELLLLEIAVALERYKKDAGDYPKELKSLIPKYLEEIPLDPATGRKTFVYRPEPQENSPFLLYSFGPNGKDDGGKQAEKKSYGYITGDHDIVF